MKNILLVGHAGFWNRGCEAIVRGTVEIIKHYLPDTQFTLLSGTLDLDTETIRKSRIAVDNVVPSVLSGQKKPSLQWILQTIDRRLFSNINQFIN